MEDVKDGNPEAIETASDYQPESWLSAHLGLDRHPEQRKAIDDVLRQAGTTIATDVAIRQLGPTVGGVVAAGVGDVINNPTQAGVQQGVAEVLPTLEKAAIPLVEHAVYAVYHQLGGTLSEADFNVRIIAQLEAFGLIPTV